VSYDQWKLRAPDWNDPEPECAACDDKGCLECCETFPVTLDDLDMEAALEADGEKLRQLTGEDHGPFNLDALSCGADVEKSQEQK
jgi:hypothetical protein